MREFSGIVEIPFKSILSRERSRQRWCQRINLLS
jgi:hypothetical protein